MRVNQPVTNTEQSLFDGESIVSQTDIKGKITYVNPAFIRISGFSEEELMGAHTIWCAILICRQRLFPTCGKI